MKGPQVGAVPRGLTTPFPVRSHSPGKASSLPHVKKPVFASESPPPSPWEQDFLTEHFQRIGHHEINHKVTGADPPTPFSVTGPCRPVRAGSAFALFSLPPALKQLEVVEIGLEGGGRAAGVVVVVVEEEEGGGRLEV